MTNQPGKSMVVLHDLYTAINKDSGTYIQLTDNWKTKLDCVGYQDVHCNNIITEQYQNGRHNCELSILQNKTRNIMENCEIAIVDSIKLKPNVHRIKDNTVLLENPQNSKIYKKCLGGSKKEYVNSNSLIEVTVPCFSAPFCEKFITTVVTSDSCVSTRDVNYIFLWITFCFSTCYLMRHYETQGTLQWTLFHG